MKKFLCLSQVFFILVLSFQGSFSYAQAESHSCATVTNLKSGFEHYLKLEKENKQLCLLQVRNQLIEMAFDFSKTSAENYLAFIKTLQTPFSQRMADIEGDMDAITLLAKGLQNEWTYTYLYKNVSTLNKDVLYAASGIGAGTLALYFVVQAGMNKKAIFKGAWTALKGVIKDPIKRGQIMQVARGVSLSAGVSGANISTDKVNSYNSNKKTSFEVLPAPAELLVFPDENRLTHTDYITIRDLYIVGITAAVGTYAGMRMTNLITSKLVVKLSGQLSPLTKGAIEYLAQIALRAQTVVKGSQVLSKGASLVTGPGMLAAVAAAAISDLLLEYGEKAANATIEASKLHTFKKDAAEISAMVNPDSSLLYLAHRVDNYTLNYLWLSQVKSQRAAIELADINNRFFEKMMCLPPAQSLPVLNLHSRNPGQKSIVDQASFRQNLRAKYRMKMIDGINETLEKWEPYRLSNIEQLKAQVQFLEQLEANLNNLRNTGGHLFTHNIKKLKAKILEYEISGDNGYQIGLSIDSAIGILGPELGYQMVYGVPSQQALDKAYEMMECTYTPNYVPESPAY